MTNDELLELLVAQSGDKAHQELMRRAMAAARPDAHGNNRRPGESRMWSQMAIAHALRRPHFVA